MKNTTPTMQDWVDVSAALLQTLMAPRDGVKWFGRDLSPAEFARTVDAESAFVDAALIAMALAPGEPQVKAIVDGMKKAALIVLFSRWAHYQTLWRQSVNNAADHWIPPNQIWRAVLLAMSNDRQHAIDVALTIWPESDAAFPTLH